MTAPSSPPTGGVSRRPTSLDVGAARASTGDDDGPLTCQCWFPNVGPNDECVRCHRVIAEHVHARRAAR